jgi:hypothetical protein
MPLEISVGPSQLALHHDRSCGLSGHAADTVKTAVLTHRRHAATRYSITSSAVASDVAGI